MNRRLVMIISDGGGEDALKGVHIDKENYLRFFKSPEGGAWEENEILVYDRNNFDVGLLKIAKMNANLERNPIEYFLIVYCGHGFTEAKTKDVYLQVRINYNLRIEDLLAAVGNTRCLLIVDSCRAICGLREGGRILDRRIFCSTEAQNTLYGQQCRAYYNQKILATCSTMQVVMFSNSFGETAEENSRNGGCYSYALLETAKAEKQRMEREQLTDVHNLWASIDCIHSKAAEKVKKETNGRQNPEVYIGTRSINHFPFLVVPHWQLQL